MWMVVAFIVVMLVAAVAMALMAKQPKTPTTEETPDVKGAQIGARIPVLFGTRLIRISQDVVWYGDLKAKPIQAPGGKK